MNDNELKYTLLFGGGAIRGVAYCGAIKVLEDMDVKFSTLAGSSVGSLIAGFMAVGYNSEEIKEIMLQVNYELFRDIQLAIGPQFALSKGEVFLEWIRETLEKKFYGENYKKGTHKAVTFTDLAKNLVIITTDLSNFECKEFSRYVTPDFEVAKAIRISCGMPGLMKPVEYNNRVLVDGDLQKSAPMWSLSKNLQPEGERIMELRLEGDFQGNDRNTVEFINAIYSYATRTGTKFLKELYGCRDKYDYVVIDTGDLNIVDFNISTEKRLELIKNGYNQTLEYFKTTLKEKKSKLLDIYTKLFEYLDNCRTCLEKMHLREAKDALGELYINICDNVELINPEDKKYLQNFTDIFTQNYKYNSFFGKAKLDNEQLVTASLKICLKSFSEKITEYLAYIKTI